MERPKLEYAENCTLIYTYARELEEYCDYLEECNNIVCSDMENLRESLDYELQVKTEKIEQLEKVLDKACELISSDVCINCYACYFEKECKSKEADKCIANNMNKEEWKEWCLKDVD